MGPREFPGGQKDAGNSRWARRYSTFHRTLPNIAESNKHRNAYVCASSLDIGRSNYFSCKLCKEKGKCCFAIECISNRPAQHYNAQSVLTNGDIVTMSYGNPSRKGSFKGSQWIDWLSLYRLFCRGSLLPLSPSK